MNYNVLYPDCPSWLRISDHGDRENLRDDRYRKVIAESENEQRIFESINKAAQFLGVQHETVRRYIQKKTVCKGYMLRHV